MTRTALQAVMAVLAVVAVVAGAATVVTGSALIPGTGEVSASVDSELRFYAAWYLGLGVLLFRTVPRVESEGTMIRAICIVLLVAAAGRALSIVVAGPPHPFYVALMLIELALPFLIVPWQAAVARRAESTTEPRR